MTLCDCCKNIDLTGLWASKSPQSHQPSFLALTLSAEVCPACDIILGCLPSPPTAGLPLPTLLDQPLATAPLKVVTVNGYKYACTVTDRPVKIDSLLFYFDDQESGDLDDVHNGDFHKADPHYFHRSLDVYAHGNSTAALNGVVGRPVSSVLNYNAIREWIVECTKSHPGCTNNPHSSTILTDQYPTRLIDVNPQVGSVKLVPSATGGAGRKYLALSHRWTNHMVRTTRQSLEAHQERLPVEELSQCFRDAIEVTQRLGFRFVWIDALCMIQDCPSDLQNEHSHMKDIYRNCSMMLAADCVKNSEESLYPVRPEFKETSLPFRITSGQQTSQWTLSNRELGAFDSDVVHGVLSSRSWTLQERILAPRTLHFGKAQVHWECAASIWWERTDFKCAFYTPSVKDEARDAIIGLNRKNIQSTFGRDRSGMGEGSTRYTLWYDLVSGYSCRQLTFSEDRLKAISGLADLFAQILQDQCIWGLWRQDMPAGLLWTVGATDRFERLAAPSWSWASTMGELTFHIPSTAWGRPLRGPLRTTCEEVLLEDAAHEQKYSNGKISCHCPMLAVHLSIHKGTEDDEEYPFDHLRTQPNAKVHEVSSGRVIGNATIDDATLLPTQYSSLPLLLHAAMLYRQDPLPDSGQRKLCGVQISLSYCILLTPLVENEVFQRFGYAEIQPEAFSEANVTKIAIL